MPTRAIVIVPQFHNREPLDAFRHQYDPLARLIPAHLILVFPFESDLTTPQLQAHVTTVAAAFRPFPIALQGITGHADEYLFLNVKRGNDTLIALHDQLYSGILAPYLSRAHTILPHLTVGRCPDPAHFEPPFKPPRTSSNPSPPPSPPSPSSNSPPLTAF